MLTRKFTICTYIGVTKDLYMQTNIEIMNTIKLITNLSWFNLSNEESRTSAITKLNFCKSTITVEYGLTSFYGFYYEGTLIVIVTLRNIWMQINVMAFKVLRASKKAYSYKEPSLILTKYDLNIMFNNGKDKTFWIKLIIKERILVWTEDYFAIYKPF